MEYEIIATLGPASQEQTLWRAMLDAGVTAFRLNTSHLSLDELRSWLDRLAAFLDLWRDACLPQPPLVLDLQGSKWRLGDFAPCELELGESVQLILAASSGRPLVLPVPHPDFFAAAPLSGGEIVLNDARVRLALETAGPDRLETRVTQAGAIAPRKGITYTASEYRQESLNEKDRTILGATRGVGYIRYALSYLRDAVEMARYRALAGPSAHLIAKLERRPAVDEAAAIAISADELWLCRGDLGAELGLAGMAAAAHDFSHRIPALNVPSILAGQVLEHMTGHPNPTRAEVCGLYDALRAGYHGIVLSDETAVGRYPLESCRAAALFRTGISALE